MPTPEPPQTPPGLISSDLPAATQVDKKNREIDATLESSARVGATTAAKEVSPGWTKKIAKGVNGEKIEQGLYIRASNGVDVNYVYRRQVNGKPFENNLGKVTKTTLDEAKKKAEKWNKKFEEVKLSGKTAQFLTQMKRDAKIKNTVPRLSKKDPIPCFRSYSDAAEFVDTVSSKLYMAFSRQWIAPAGSITVEVYVMIWVMLLTPLGIDDLLHVKYENIYECNHLQLQQYTKLHPEFDHESKLILKLAKFNQDILVNIPNLAMNYLLKLQELSGGAPSNTLFQQLHNLKKTERDYQIKSVLNEIWSKYPVDPKQFVQFFQYAADRHSSFKPDFIKSFIKIQHRELHIYSFAEDRRLLSNWWEKQIASRFKSYPGSKFKPQQNQAAFIPS